MENEPITARGLAIITGADGGMGTEITRAVALAGYRVIMASCRPQRAEALRRTLMHEQSGLQIEVRYVDLASLASVADFAEANRIRLRVFDNPLDDFQTDKRRFGRTAPAFKPVMRISVFFNQAVQLKKRRGDQRGQFYLAVFHL